MFGTAFQESSTRYCYYCYNLWLKIQSNAQKAAIDNQGKASHMIRCVIKGEELAP